MVRGYQPVVAGPLDQATLDQIRNHFLSNGGAMGNQPRPQQKRGRGGTATSLISEAGGTGGALAGAAYGAAAGSILPGAGTLVGGLIGAGIGGFAGGFGGRLAENKIRDDEFRPGQALGEGVISGIAGAGPIRGLKAAGAGSKALMSTAPKLEDALLAANTALDKPGVLSTIGNKISDSGDNFTTRSFRFTPSQMGNFAGKHGEDVKSVISRYRFKTPDQIEHAASQLQAEFDNGIEAMPPIPKSTVMNKLNDIIKPLLKGPALHDQSLGRELSAQADEINKAYGKEVPASVLNDLRKRFDNITAVYKGNQVHPARHDVNKQAADAIRHTLQDEADKAGVTFGDSGDTLKDFGTELSKLYDLSKYATKQSNLGRGAQTLRLTDTIGAGVGGATGGPLGAAGAAGATHLINSRMGTRAIGSGLRGVGSAVGLPDRMAGTAAGAGARVLGADAFIGAGNSMADAQNPQQGGGLEDAMMGAYGDQGDQGGLGGLDPSQDPSATADQSPYSRENLVADMQRDPKNADKYYAMYKNLQEAYNPAPTKASSNYSKPTASQVSQATSAESSINDLFGQATKNPGLVAKSAIPGQSLPMVGGLISRAAGTGAYNSESAAILNAIARINTGANMPASELGFYSSKYLPQPGDSPAALRQKYQSLQAFFSPILNYQDNSNGSGLEDMIYNMQQQQSAY